MQELLTYSLKVAAVMVVFYLFYKVLLARETFHRLNRIVLLAIAPLSMTLPLCVITIRRTVVAESAAELLSLTPIEMVEQSAVAADASGWDWWLIGGIVAIAGAVVVAVWSAVSVISVRKIVREGREVERNGRERIVLTSKKIAPFSWMNTIVLSEDDLSDGYDIVVAHERAHIRLRHSVDMLLLCYPMVQPCRVAPQARSARGARIRSRLGGVAGGCECSRLSTTTNKEGCRQQILLHCQQPQSQYT